MPERENIHACWSLMPQFDKSGGAAVSAGLLALGGHDGNGALRELKKRCDAELEHAGKPLIGCAMYVNMILSWVKTALEYKERLKGTEVILNYAADKSFRQGFENSFRLTGEDEIADLIEETWEQYQEDIPDGVRMDVEEDIVDILEDKYCHVGLEPKDFTPAEITTSKTIALDLGKRKSRRKRRKPTAKPAREESPEEPEPETVIEPPGETAVKTAKEMRDEVRSKLKRA